MNAIIATNYDSQSTSNDVTGGNDRSLIFNGSVNVDCSNDEDVARYCSVVADTGSGEYFAQRPHQRRQFEF